MGGVTVSELLCECERGVKAYLVFFSMQHTSDILRSHWHSEYRMIRVHDISCLHPHTSKENMGVSKNPSLAESLH